MSQIVEHTEIDEHLEQIAENLIVEHLIYTIFIATNNRTSGIFFHCVNSQTRLTIRDTRVHVSGVCFKSFFSYLRDLKLSLTILCVKVGQNTFYFICNSSGQNLHMHFEESLSIEWVLRLMFWKKAVTWTTMNIAILITNNHTLACISVKCLQMDLYHHNPLSTLKGI